MRPFFLIKVKITQLWCWLTGADAVYVKDIDNNTYTVKVMRTVFDPFQDQQPKKIKFLRYGYRVCNHDGTVSHSWKWRYVSNERHVQHKLSC